MHYSLPAILAVGYRVRSARGTQFRQWATATLSEFVIKGFALDDQRLKNPPGPGVPDYFDELLARIRDIRPSERRMYMRARVGFGPRGERIGAVRKPWHSWVSFGRLPPSKGRRHGPQDGR
jgi:hypothetical protein